MDNTLGYRLTLLADEFSKNKLYDTTTTEGMAASIAWTQKVLDALNDKGGVWVVPNSTSVVFVDKPNKTVTIEPHGDHDPDVEQVMAAMGWTVLIRGE